jgi:hypothetical protein
MMNLHELQCSFPASAAMASRLGLGTYTNSGIWPTDYWRPSNFGEALPVNVPAMAVALDRHPAYRRSITVSDQDGIERESRLFEGPLISKYFQRQIRITFSSSPV